MEFDVGDIVDVESVDIFYPAIIVSIHYAFANGSLSSSASVTAQRYSSSSLSHIIVHYFGWEARYDEKLSADELSTRVFPGGMYVKKYKVWTYLSPSYPVWPCYLYIRPAKDGNKDAVKFLKKETLMLIIPYGTSLSCMKDFRNGERNVYICTYKHAFRHTNSHMHKDMHVGMLRTRTQQLNKCICSEILKRYFSIM
jgi:hypothetical protein